MIIWQEFKFPALNLNNMARTIEMQEIWYNKELEEMYYV